jgi:hypothetical protein
VEKDGEDNRKIGKVNQIINQMPSPRLKHDKIQTIWVLDILSKNIMERVGLCKHSKMES